MKEYRARGMVIGNLWGGGIGGYPSEELKAKTKEDILKQANKGVKEGTLDSGMGFDGLRGAVLNIEEIETIEKNGKKYSRSEYIMETIGNLTEREEELCLENM